MKNSILAIAIVINNEQLDGSFVQKSQPENRPPRDIFLRVYTSLPIILLAAKGAILKGLHDGLEVDKAKRFSRNGLIGVAQIWLHNNYT